MDLTNINKDRKARRKSSLDLSTMVYGKVPPQAKDLEEAVLGAIMLEKSAFDTVVEILKPECFYVDSHQRIYRAMQSLQQKNQPIDILTVVEELKVREELDIVGGPYFVTRLTNAVISSANIEAHSRIILQKFIQRELIRISGEIIGDAYEESTDVFDLLDDAESKLFEITNNRLKVIKIIALAKSAIRNNLGEELNQIKQPTCLIWGNNDTITPPFVGREFNRLIPNSELHFVDKCGHAPMMEVPDEFNRILEGFLNKLKS